MRRKIGVGLLALGGAGALLTGSAGAAPEEPFTANLTCGGTTYEVVVRGNGEFTPAHDVDSNAVFVPVAFGSFTGVIRNAAGQVVASQTEPGGETKGQSGKRSERFTPCTYTFTFTNTSSQTMDGVPPGGTFTGTGVVLARMVGGS